MKIEKIRDLTLIKVDDKNTMVIACDSCGGVGLKEHDVLKVPPFYIGKFTARVALLEVMSSGAKVMTLVDTVCNEMDKTGSEIIRGIKEELKQAQIDEIVLTGSTEENFPTTSTALGVTVIGICDNKKLKIAKVEESSIIISIGIPKVGNEINLDFDEDIISYDLVKYLLSLEDVLEIIPVGSKGILYEAELLATTNNLKLKLEQNIVIDINKSSGPATCVLVIVKKSFLGRLEIIKNVNIIGSLIAYKEGYLN